MARRTKVKKLSRDVKLLKMYLEDACNRIEIVYDAVNSSGQIMFPGDKTIRIRNAAHEAIRGWRKIV